MYMCVTYEVMIHMHVLCIDGFKVPAEKKDTHMIDMIHTTHACMHACMHKSYIHVFAYMHMCRVSASTWIGRSSQMTFRARPLLVLACPLHQVTHTDRNYRHADRSYGHTYRNYRRTYMNYNDTHTEIIDTHTRTDRRTDKRTQTDRQTDTDTDTFTHTHTQVRWLMRTPLLEQRPKKTNVIAVSIAALIESFYRCVHTDT